MSADDKYTYPGSGGVLVNKFGLLDAAQLDRALNDMASLRWAALAREPLPERLDVAHLRKIHRRLFDDILPFAGQIRDVDTGADGTAITYCRPEFIAEMSATIDRDLERDGYLRELPRREFVSRLAYHWGEITALHPMRDGNTRSQSAFVTQLAASAGFSVQWSRVDVRELRELRLRAVVGSVGPLADRLSEWVVPFEPSDPEAATRALDRLAFE